MAVLHLILHITIKREDGSSMKPAGDRRGRWEEAKWGNLWDWMKGPMTDTSFSHTGGHRVVTHRQLTRRQ